MIIDLQSTTISHISKTLLQLREEGGAIALGRVLTLVVSSDIHNEDHVIAAAVGASREHPMRIIVVSKNLSPFENSSARIDAQIRIGTDAGAGEVIVLRAFGDAACDEESLITGLLLPDTPIVAWWPDECPDNPAQSALGRIATRRITDCSQHQNPAHKLAILAQNYSPGDTDLAWTRLTLWRTQLAAVLDQPPYEPVLGVELEHSSMSVPVVLLTTWLETQLHLQATHTPHDALESPEGLARVRFVRNSGIIELKRKDEIFACLTQPNHPTHTLSMPRRQISDCLAEELRRLDSDDLYGSVLTRISNIQPNHL